MKRVKSVLFVKGLRIEIEWIRVSCNGTVLTGGDERGGGDGS